jgi:hypothetical protein
MSQAEIKEAIGLLEKVVRKYMCPVCGKYSGESNSSSEHWSDCYVDKALALLRGKEPCKTCGGSGKVQKECEACALDMPHLASECGGSKPCPDCQEPKRPKNPDRFLLVDGAEEPEASGFTKECRTYIKGSPIMSNNPCKGYAIRLSKTCDIIDSQAGELKKKDELLFAYESVRAPKSKDNKQLRQDLIDFGRHSRSCNYPYNPNYGCKCGWLEVEKTLKETS